MNYFLHRSLVILIMVGLTFFSQQEILAQKKKVYTEDLKYLRPQETATSVADSGPLKKQSVTATHTVNDKVNSILDSLDNFSKSKRFTDGFTVQIYSGQKKQEAMDASNALGESDLGLVADIQFVQPKFRVIVGKYYNRLEAHRDLFRLRKIFPDAIIIPEKVPIR
jgi:hypothetical protein